MTITVFACYDKGNFSFSGLHQDIMIYRADSKEIELIETTGIWIGLIDNIDDTLMVDQFSLKSGDVILLYTDGLTESTDENKNMYSDERLVEVFKNLGNVEPEEIKKGLLASLDSYTCDDDVTLMLVKKT